MNPTSLIEGPQKVMVPRTKLSNRMKLAATLIATGYTVPETANFLNLNKAHLAIVVRSGLFQNEVEKVRSKFTDSVIADVKRKLIAEAPRSIEKIVAIRDKDDVKLTGESRKAAQYIVDKVIGKGEGNEKNTGNKGNQVIIQIGGEEAKILESVAAEFKEISTPGNGGDNSSQ